MNKYIKSISAGVVATAIVAGLLFLKHSMGIIPDWTLPYEATLMFDKQPVPAWLIQVVLGVIVWPIIFAVILDFFNGPYWIRGVAFALIAWYVMPVILGPIFGKEILAGKDAMQLMSLMHLGILIYVVYGFLLGLFFTLCHKCCNR